MCAPYKKTLWLSIVLTIFSLGVPVNSSAQGIQELATKLLRDSVPCAREPNLVNGEKYSSAYSYTGDRRHFQIRTDVTWSRANFIVATSTWKDIDSFDLSDIDKIEVEEGLVTFYCKAGRKCVDRFTEDPETIDSKMPQNTKETNYKYDACDEESAVNIQKAAQALQKQLQ